MRAWWAGGGVDLADIDSIVGRLATRLVETHSLNREAQLRAWREQAVLLRAAIAGLPGLRVLLEYPLLRLGRRIDAVLLTDRAILVLEFKIGAAGFHGADRMQVEDYALDLFDFHAASRHHPIVPILVASDARPAPTSLPLIWHGVTPVLEASAAALPGLVQDVLRQIPPPRTPLDVMGWDGAAYRPVPTIVEAATMLYRRHGVSEIAAARADVGNLSQTTDTILRAIREAADTRTHRIVFVTGIPGAGKTLCGLNAVFGADAGAAFLTGNLPLVHVLREALARDAANGQRNGLRMARQRTKSAIQPLLGFLRDNVPRADPPHEHVIVFDEAQRAWDAAYGKRKFGLDNSEAALFLDIMQRHRDWAVIVALVGSGQEINTGEAGLSAWGEALLARPQWQISAAPGVLTGDDPRRRLFASAPANLQIDPALHLAVPVRAIRSSAAAPWVDAVLDGDAQRAAAIATEAGGVPFLLTRSLGVMRAALRAQARGTRRAGLVCSAGAKRLRADGIWPEFPHLDDTAVAQWFLDRWPDVRASDALEMPATQFACQGLELDLVGLCWGGDLIRRAGQTGWQARRFIGTDWRSVRAADDIAYQVNTYRVLLTRARYETVIWVPPGDPDDATRDPATLDAIAAFLHACGAGMLAADSPTLSELPA
jgi:hypothetical protein